MSQPSTTMPDFPDEVVTRALVRYVDVPGLPEHAKQAALITLDNGHDHRKPNTLGPAGLAELDRALDEIAARTPEVAFIALTGKPYIFVVGADLTGMPLITGRHQALAIAQAGHRVLARLRDSAIPTFAFVNGATMGGGLEVALHCHYRTLSSGAAAIAFPECFLGLVPGWGGTQLLPNLIGPAGAVQVIVENALNQNKMLRAAQAYELGIADVMFEPADFLERSLAWAVAVVTGDISVVRGEIDRSDGWTAALTRGRDLVDSKLHGAAPAPYRALDLMDLARTADFGTGTAAEDEALADLLLTDELRAGLYAFDLTQRRAKRQPGAPATGTARPVTKVGIVGAGLMASQLALLFARRLDVPVVLTDLDQDRIDRGLSYVYAEVDRLRARGRISPDQAGRLRASVTGSLDLAAFADTDFVIEAVFEDIAVKKKVFADLEAVVAPTCVLATNTSSLSVTEMAADLRHPERVVGFHFFNPVAVMPLLEIVRGEQCDDGTLATAFAVGKQLKKSCVLVRNAPGFVVNRLLLRFLGEVIRAVDEGTPIPVADRALDPLGLPMRPFALLQFVGPAVTAHVAGVLHEAFPDRYGVSDNLARLVAAGKPGVYTADAHGDLVVDPEVTALLEVGDTPLTEEQVAERALAALAEEIHLMLDGGMLDGADTAVVAEPQDIDMCMLLGAGWPFHLGGITPYLDRTGIAERVTGRRFLPPGLASLPGR